EVIPLLDRLLDRSVDGVILTTSRLDGTVPSELSRRSLPFVFLTRFVAGIALEPALVRHGPFTFETGHAAMTDLLDCAEPPTVVLCGNDTVAIGAFNAAVSLGRAVPADVSIVGFDDLPMAGWEIFNLTTVHQPIDEMARTAVDLLVDRIEGGVESSTVRQRVFEPRMIMRGTLAPPPHR